MPDKCSVNVVVKVDQAAVEQAAEVGRKIRAVNDVPSGQLYAGLSGRMTFDEFCRALAALKKSKLVTESKDRVLMWVGPPGK